MYSYILYREIPRLGNYVDALMACIIFRSRIKMSYQTHYVGDLRYLNYVGCPVVYMDVRVSWYCKYIIIPFSPFRAINNNLIDTYQLKSLDGQFGMYIRRYIMFFYC